MIDARSGVPAWRQLADAIRDRIARGEYPPGARLPSELHLGQEFELGRNTVRRAMAELRAEGVIVVEHGYGTRVRSLPEPEVLTGESGQIVSVRMPTQAERETYALADGVPMLVVTDQDGMEYAHPGDSYVLRIV